MRNNPFQNNSFNNNFQRLRLSRGFTFGIVIFIALIAFEFFNFSTTQYALEDLLGNLTFLGLPWATVLAIAFCGIDFAGIARLNTPVEGSSQPNETWYLFGAWLLAATMNALLTWWGVSLALITRAELGNSVIDRSTLLRVVPVFIAVLVWIIRVLIIGTFANSGPRLLSQTSKTRARNPNPPQDIPEISPSRPFNNQPLSANPYSSRPRSFSPPSDSHSRSQENGGSRSRSL